MRLIPRGPDCLRRQRSGDVMRFVSSWLRPHRQDQAIPQDARTTQRADLWTSVTSLFHYGRDVAPIVKASGGALWMSPGCR
jgi:hypothetical protein